MTEARRSKILIEYNGVDATEIIADKCDSFTWVDHAAGTADTVTIGLSNCDGKWMRGFYPSKKDTFKAWIRMSGWEEERKNEKVYCGIFMVDSLRFSGFPETLQLSGISTPTNCNINIKQKNKTWKKTTVKTILGDISKNAGLSLVFDAKDVNVDTVNQSGKTDLAFANSLCSEYDIALKIYNKKMVAYDQTAYEKKKARYDITREQLGGSGAYSITRQITTVFDSVKIQYTDEKKGETLTYQFTIPGTSGKRQMFITTKAESHGDAEKKAKAALRENLRQSQILTLRLMGSAKYTATDCFNLKGFGKLDGKYFVDSVTHSKAGGNYTVSLTAHLTVTEF